MKKKVLVSSVLTILLALSLIAGATFALFTSESRTNIAITSGKVSVIAEVDQDSIMTKQLGRDYDAGSDNTFTGEVIFDGNEISLVNLVPGDGVKFNVNITNNSNIPVLYRVKLFCTAGETGTIEDSQLLFSALNFKVGGTDFSDVIYYASAWTRLAVGAAPASVEFEIELPEEAGNEYQDLETKIVYTVEAVQGNAGLTAGEEFVWMDGSANLTNNGIVIDIPAGAMDTYTSPTLSVEKPAQSSNFNIVADGGITYQVLNIEFQGLKADNDKEITITIPVDSEMHDAIVYYNNGTELIAMPTEYVNIDGNHYIRFTTTHFSEYILLEKAVAVTVTAESGKHTVAYDLTKALKAIRANSVVKLHQDATVGDTVLIDYGIVIDLNGYNITADPAFAKPNSPNLFQVRTQSQSFTITNTQEEGGVIDVNGRSLVLAYAPVSLENVEIINCPTKKHLIQSYSSVELEYTKIINTEAIEESLFLCYGFLSLGEGTEIEIGEVKTWLIEIEGSSSVECGLMIDGAKITVPSMKFQQVIYRNDGASLDIRDIDLNVTYTGSRNFGYKLDFLYNDRGSADGSTMLSISGGSFMGIEGIAYMIDEQRSYLKITGGTFTCDPTMDSGTDYQTGQDFYVYYVDMEQYDVIHNEENGTWTVVSK